MDDSQIFPRGLRAKLPLYNDVMTKYGLTPLTNEEIERIIDEFNSTGCTSFILTPKQIELILEECD